MHALSQPHVCEARADDESCAALCGQQGSSGVLASIQGSGYAFERQRCAAEAAKRAGVAGFSLAGLGMESREERAALMAAAVSELPAHLPRFLLAGAGRTLTSPRSFCVLAQYTCHA